MKGEGGMKLEIGIVANRRKAFQWSLLLVMAVAALSGCNGNYGGVFPVDWNIPNAPGAQAHPTNIVSGDEAGIALQSIVNSSSAAPPALLGGLQRQADCSLTYFDFSYA